MTSYIFNCFCFCLLIDSLFGFERNLYHVQTVPSQINQLIHEHPGEVDMWSRRLAASASFRSAEPLLDIDLWTTERVANKLEEKHGRKLTVLQQGANNAAKIAKEKADVQACLQANADWAAKVTPTSKLRESTYFKCFRPYNEMAQMMDKMVETRKDIITKYDVSKTTQGETIRGYKIGLPGGSDNKAAVYVQGIVHAREWLSGPTTMYSMASLLDDIQAKEASVMKELAEVDYYFVPVVNIDGYKYTWTDAPNARYWRKNRRANPGGTVGVDLNRNYGPTAQFCGEGASKNPADDTYCGPNAFSEPEITGIDQFLKTKNILGGVDVHCYSNLVLFPNGYTAQPVPGENGQKLAKMSADIANAVNAKAGGQFKPLQAGKLYPAAGGFDDNMFSSYKKPSITFELRGTDFIIDKSEIAKSGPEIYDGIRVFSQNARTWDAAAKDAIAKGAAAPAAGSPAPAGQQTAKPATAPAAGATPATQQTANPATATSKPATAPAAGATPATQQTANPATATSKPATGAAQAPANCKAT